MSRIPPETLQNLRNDLDVVRVIARLDIPTKIRGSRLAFRCPDCGRYETSTGSDRNLARCFPCARNFNPIDLVMAQRGVTFLEAVCYLEDLLYGH
jgi:DNA primase